MLLSSEKKKLRTTGLGERLNF